MSSSSGLNLKKYLIPLDEIKRATDNFSHDRIIGDGGFGAVYRGQLSERWKNCRVAVKQLSPDSYQGEHEFRNEIELISRFHHENVISFIGYCDEGGEMIIVYEYAMHASLDHHLQDPNKMIHMTWAQRLEICIGAAKGLHYLHSGLGETSKVIHRDVKSANILLDDNMVAKICDFGLSKSGTRNVPEAQLFTKVAGTSYYLDPAYHESGILRVESDVYSFGIVLFEMVSGMLVYRERRIGDERQSLMYAVRQYEQHQQSEPDNVIDPCIRDQIKSPSFETFKDIAYQCICPRVSERPMLHFVIMKLEMALLSQISKHSASTPSDLPTIKSIIGNLNSVSPYIDQQIASCEISLLTKYCHENRAAFGKAGAIPLLTHLLTAPDSRTQEHAVTALLNLSHYEDNRGIIVSSTGAVSGIVHVLEKGSNVARENAANTIYSISMADEAEVTIGSAGAIPPLVLLLGEGATTTGKGNAAGALRNLCVNDDNRARAVRAGVVPILVEFITEPQGVWKNESVALLERLSRHPEGKLAIGEGKAVPHLVEVIGCGNWRCEEDAVTILGRLCCMDEKYLVEAQEQGVMEKMKYMREYGMDRGKRKAREIRRMIKDHQHVDYGSDAEEDIGVVPSGSVMFEPDPTDSRLTAQAKRGALKISKIFDKFHL